MNSSQEKKDLFSDKQKRVATNFLEHLLKDEDSKILYDEVKTALDLWNK